jgi:hypothetical protein
MPRSWHSKPCLLVDSDFITAERVSVDAASMCIDAPVLLKVLRPGHGSTGPPTKLPSPICGQGDTRFAHGRVCASSPLIHLYA